MKTRWMGVVALGSLLVASACDDEQNPDEAESRSASVDPRAVGGAAPVVRPRADGDKFRVVLLADPHVVGPDYEFHEGANNESDSVSLLRTEQRLLEVQQRINRLDPQPEAVFVLGDLVSVAHDSEDLSYYDDRVTAWSISADLFDGFDAPVYPLFGNHDYGGFDCDTPDDVYFEWHRDLFDKFYGREPYYAVDLHGFRFLLLDGQLGLRCQEKTGEAAYGRTQLDWVADQIDEGLPTFVLSHYMSLIWSSEETTGPNPDLDTVVAERSDVVQGIFAGHTHRWLNGSTTSPGGVEEWVLGAVRYDPDNFWVLELDPSDGSWAIVDFDKHRYSTTCADTYRYDDGAPRKMADAPETGDCVALSDFEDLP